MKTKALCIIFVALLCGCSTASERTGYQEGAGKAPPLEVPPDLVLPKTDNHYAVPEGTEQAAKYSDYARSNKAQSPACICKETAATPASGVQPAAPTVAAASTSTTVVQPPKLKTLPDGGKSILIAEPFDRCWLRVRQAVDKAHIALDDWDRSKGVLFLKGGHKQVTVRATEAGCEVAANDGSGGANKDTDATIDALYKSLSK